MNSTDATLKRKRSLNEDDLSCSFAGPEVKGPRTQESRNDAGATNSCADRHDVPFNSVALRKTDILQKVPENASNKHISNSVGFEAAREDDEVNHSPARNTRFQSWVNERQDRERIRNVERATRYHHQILVN